MSVTIKKCQVQDLKAIQEVSIQTFTDTFLPFNTKENIDKYVARAFTDEKLISEVNDAHSQFFLAYIGHEVCGYLKVNEYPAQTEKTIPDSLEVERIYVKKEFKRQHVGSALMEQAIQIAQAKKVKQLWLGVWEKNTVALSFYQKNGFKKESSHTFHMGDKEQTDYLMVKVL